MFNQIRLSHWSTSVRNQLALPLRVILWNGQQLDFSQEAPRVTIRVPQPSALRYLLSPSLINLGSAYVEGAIEVSGRATDMIAIVNALARTTIKNQHGVFARVAGLIGVVVGVVASAITAFFYARVVVLMFFNEPAPDGPTVAIPSPLTATAIALGVAVGLKSLMSIVGIDIPTKGLVVTSSTIGISLFVGVAITALETVTITALEDSEVVLVDAA